MDKCETMELLPCAHCGGIPYFSTCCNVDYFVLCDCGIGTSDYKTPEEAAAVWNRRTPDIQRLQERIKELEEQKPVMINALRKRLHEQSFEIETSSPFIEPELSRVVDLDEIDSLMDEFDAMCGKRKDG